MNSTAPSPTAETSASLRSLFTRVFIALCVLTGLSFAVAQIDLPGNQWVIWTGMIVISMCKAFLVVAFFMHLKWELAWKWALTIPALVMGIILTVSLIPDVGNRSNHQNGNSTSLQNLPEPVQD